MLRYVDLIVAIAADAANDRWLRAMLRYQTGRKDGAIEWKVRHPLILPPGLSVTLVKADYAQPGDYWLAVTRRGVTPWPGRLPRWGPSAPGTPPRTRWRPPTH